jgi:serine/threonine protein phosphatase PrpC
MDLNLLQSKRRVAAQNDKGLHRLAAVGIGKGRQIHVVHVGDTRLYRLRGDQLQQLTVDHSLGPDKLNLLTRAVGADDELRIDYIDLPNEQHDRYLLCSDGVHGGLSDATLREILVRRAAPDETAREIVAQAIAARVGDNATALIVDRSRTTAI